MTAPKFTALEVMGEYCSSGIWARGLFGPFRHGNVAYELLGIPEELREKFRKWILTYHGLADHSRNGKPADFGAFNEEGLRLAVELQAFMGPTCKVTYTPQTDY